MKSLNAVSLILMLPLIATGQRTAYQNTSATIQLSDSKHAKCNNRSTCPTWFTCNSNGRCECKHSDNDGIICDNEKLSSALLDCYCVTYDEDSGSTFVGPCLFNCQDFNFNATIRNDLYIYHYLPRYPEKLINHSVCTHFHRRGLLCGDCEAGHSPLVFSYNLSCVPCPNGQRNWWKFILAGFFPLTLFYLFVLLFNINVTSSHLHGAVQASQLLSLPVFVRVLLLALEVHGNLTIGKLIVTFYSYWNLNLFRSVLPNICLNVTTLQALALEYLIALYPFLLIAISYLMITLYNYKRTSLLLYVWKPFQKLQINVRKSWDVRTSVIDSFSTFFLSSYMKILSVTSDILTPIQIEQLDSNKTQFALYYSPSVPYFGAEHLPYAILAITILTIFVITPTVIFILYPCQSFQKFLSLFPINWHFLHAFVDSFQGCYKDGTEPGTFDCRWFSVITLIVNPVLLILVCLALSAMYLVYSLIVLLILIIVLINIEPYKKMPSSYPPTDFIFLSQLGLTSVAILGTTCSNSYNLPNSGKIWIVTSLVVGLLPVIYTCYLIGSWLFSRRKWIMCK